MRRGDVCWCDLGAPSASGPGKRWPSLVLPSDAYHRSRLATTIVVALTSNTTLSTKADHVFLPATATGLPKESVANVTTPATADQDMLDHHPAGEVPVHLLAEIERGVRQVLGLS